MPIDHPGQASSPLHWARRFRTHHQMMTDPGETRPFAAIGRSYDPVVDSADDDVFIEGEASRGRRLWGTEETPTRLRKVWWVLKEAFFTPWS